MNRLLILGAAWLALLTTALAARAQSPQLEIFYYTVNSGLVENGPARTALLKRSGPTDEPLTVRLFSDDRSEATVPATVTIPAGASQKVFSITPVDDAILDGPQQVTITAMTAGYGSTAIQVTVQDDDLKLTLSIEDSVIDEDAGIGATFGRVTLNHPALSRMFIRVFSSQPDRVLINGIVPGRYHYAYVTLEPGQSSGTFRVDTIDNGTRAGYRTAQIGADVSYPFDPDYRRTTFVRSEIVTLGIRDDELLVRLRVQPQTLVEGQTIAAQVFLGSADNPAQPYTVLLESSRPDIVIVPTAVSVAAGRQGNTFFIKVAPDSIDGAPQNVTITARRQGYVSATTTLQIVDANAPRLSLKIAPRVVQESGENAAGGLVSISTPQAEPVTVRLSVSDEDQARVPPTVVIPPGSTLARFSIEAIVDRLGEGTRDITIFAEADNFAPARAPLAIRDATPFVTASLTTPQLSERAGPDAARVVVKLSRPTRETINVFLSVSDSRLSVPISVSFAPGQTLLSIPVTVVDNDAVDDDGNDDSHRARISVRQPFSSTAFYGTPPIELPLQIFDDDRPLSLEISNTRLSERAPRTARATVTRQGSLAEPLVVTLRPRASDSTPSLPLLLRVPRAVTIPAGARSVSFEVGVADNEQAFLFGDQVNFLTVSATIAGQSVETTLDIEIEDDDRTLLGVLFDSDTIGESGITRAFATLLLPGPAKADYTFFLINTHPSRLQVPQAVVIAKGQKSVTFPVDAINNTRDDGDVHVQITPRKPGFRGLESAIRVLDDDGYDGTE